MGSIEDVFVEKAITERRVNIINIRYVKVKAMESKTRHSVITLDELSCTFNIGIKKVKCTLRIKTQKGIRYVVHPLYRRYIVNNMQFRRKCLNLQFYTDHNQD